MYKEKKEVINHYQKSIDFVNQLRELPLEKWRTPIEEGKWTVAEIIGHLIPWDEFVLKKRLPCLSKAVQLPASPNTELINQQAAKLSRGRSKSDTIDSFIEMRKELIKELADLPEELWTYNLSINGDNKSLQSYFTGLIEHDIHHYNQIQRVL